MTTKPGWEAGCGEGKPFEKRPRMCQGKSNVVVWQAKPEKISRGNRWITAGACFVWLSRDYGRLSAGWRTCSAGYQFYIIPW